MAYTLNYSDDTQITFSSLAIYVVSKMIRSTISVILEVNAVHFMKSISLSLLRECAWCVGGAGGLNFLKSGLCLYILK